MGRCAGHSKEIRGVTLIVVLVLIALAAVALHWWSSRQPDPSAEHGPPPLLLPIDPAHLHMNGNGANGNGDHAADLSVAESLAVESLRTSYQPPVRSTPPNHPPVSSPPTNSTPVSSTPVSSTPVSSTPTNSTPVSHAPVRPFPVSPPAVPQPPYAPPPPRVTPASVAPVHLPEPDPLGTETVRFVRPSDLEVALDGAVQLLPGRLEILEGPIAHREIRFMRFPGQPARVILGREPRVTPHYIGLESPTVSRRHAQFDFTDKRWFVKNLSRTNPVVINDEQLSDTDAARPLEDGDRIELGDVILRFHAR